MEIILIHGRLMSFYKLLLIIKTIVQVITIIINMKKTRISLTKMQVKAISLIINKMGNSNFRRIIKNKKHFNNKKMHRMFNQKKKKISNHREINVTIIKNYLKN